MNEWDPFALVAVTAQADAARLEILEGGPIRAWTVDGARLYGCILRNSLTVTWMNSREQSDAGPHTEEHALRDRGGLPTAESGGPA